MGNGPQGHIHCINLKILNLSSDKKLHVSLDSNLLKTVVFLYFSCFASDSNL